MGKSTIIFKNKPTIEAVYSVGGKKEAEGCIGEYIDKCIEDDYFGEKTEYVTAVKIFGGDIWQNVKLELNNFKTKDGMGIKSYDKIQAVEFSADGEFLVNNFLWV